MGREVAGMRSSDNAVEGCVTALVVSFSTNCLVSTATRTRTSRLVQSKQNWDSGPGAGSLQPEK